MRILFLSRSLALFFLSLSPPLPFARTLFLSCLTHILFLFLVLSIFVSLFLISLFRAYVRALSLFVSLSLSLSLSLFLSLSHSRCLFLSPTHTHTHTCRSLFLSNALSLEHTLSRVLYFSLARACSLTCAYSLFFSLSGQKHAVFDVPRPLCNKKRRKADSEAQEAKERKGVFELKFKELLESMSWRLPPSQGMQQRGWLRHTNNGRVSDGRDTPMMAHQSWSSLCLHYNQQSAVVTNNLLHSVITICFNCKMITNNWEVSNSIVLESRPTETRVRSWHVS